MMKYRMMVAGVAAALLAGGCDNKKNPPPADGKQAEAGNQASNTPPVATHLGFASRVPKDADFFAAGFHADQALRALVDAFVKPEEMKPGDSEEIQNIVDHIGGEAFVFVGAGAGSQLEMLAKTHRDVSSVITGQVVGALLDGLANKDTPPDFEKLNEEVFSDLAEKWLDNLEKNSRIQLPGLVMGWKPDAAKESKCRDAVIKWMDEVFVSDENVRPVKFEAGGVAFTGYEIPGREAFGEAIAKARGELAKNEGGSELLEQITQERVNRFLDAMENLRLTLATGTVYGRVLLYFGNGAEGFHLASSPAESLAASPDLAWTCDFASERIAATVYLSEHAIRSVLPLLDSSDQFDAISRAIRPPVREQRLLRELLTGLADTERQLAIRDASAWSAVCFENNGLHLETRGGWPDPALDYETPLRMTDAAIAQKPAIRAHWIQQRGRNDLAWKRMEHYGALIDALLGEIDTPDNPLAAMIPAGTLDRIVKEVGELNRAYRGEFRAGIGDEVAFIADFQGEVPPVPGISEETVQTAKAPRFIVARPVLDRPMIDASGKSFVRSWRSLTAWACELSGQNLPLIVPQSIESDGLVTWYPPLPFIGGDFMPGVTMNDNLWMLGTSRSLAGGFSKSMATASSGGDNGMIVEIEFAPIREWLTDIYQRNETEAKELTAEAPDEMKQLADKENLERATSALNRLQGLGYRHWMAGGEPRTSLHLRINAAK